MRTNLRLFHNLWSQTAEGLVEEIHVAAWPGTEVGRTLPLLPIYALLTQRDNGEEGVLQPPLVVGGEQTWHVA